MRKKGKIGSVRLTWQKQIRVEREAVVHGEEEQLHNRVPKDHLLPYLPPNQISLSLSLQVYTPPFASSTSRVFFNLPHSLFSNQLDLVSCFISFYLLPSSIDYIFLPRSSISPCGFCVRYTNRLNLPNQIDHTIRRSLLIQP